MDNDLATRARARLAIRKSLWLLSDPNIGMLDFGFPEREDELCTDEVTIRAHVNKKFSRSGGISLESAMAQGQTGIDLTGKEIDGFKIDVVEGRYHTNIWDWRQSPQANRRASRLDPMCGGISISDENHVTYGTLGGKVIDRSGREMILSNWHVLVGSWTAQPGLRIFQPGRRDGGTYNHVVARLTRHAMDAGIDAAVAELTGDRALVNDQLGIGPVTGVDMAYPGMRVIKSGRASDRTSGIVEAVDGVASITYTGRVTRMIRHVVTIGRENGGYGSVSSPGDSGSFWLARGSNAAIGLHFAGSDLPERGLAIDMQQVLDALGVELAVRAEAKSSAAPARTVWSGFTPVQPVTPASPPAPQTPPVGPRLPWLSREFYQPEPDELPLSTYSNGNGAHHDGEEYP